MVVYGAFLGQYSSVAAMDKSHDTLIFFCYTLTRRGRHSVFWKSSLNVGRQWTHVAINIAGRMKGIKFGRHDHSRDAGVICIEDEVLWNFLEALTSRFMRLFDFFLRLWIFCSAWLTLICVWREVPWHVWHQSMGSQLVGLARRPFFLVYGLIALLYGVISAPEVEVFIGLFTNRTSSARNLGVWRAGEYFVAFRFAADCCSFRRCLRRKLRSIS